MPISPKAQKILGEDRKLDLELVAKLGWESATKSDGSDWIVIPYFSGNERVNSKTRTISGEKKFYQEPDAKKCFYNINALMDATLESLPIIITEGEIDCVSVLQSGHARCVSVPDGAPAEALGDKETQKYTYLNDAQKLFNGSKEIILATDGDGPGINLRNDLALRLGRSRCKWVKYPWKRDKVRRCKDMNEVLIEYGERGVTECLQKADWINKEGVYCMNELPPLRERVAHKIGFPALDDHYKIRLGDFCVIVGYASGGKSSWLNDIACRIVQNHGWRIAFASFEQEPQTDHKRNLMTWFLQRNPSWATAQQISDADFWINRNFRFMIPSEDDQPTLKWLLEKMTIAVVQHDCKIIIIDPWNEMSHIWDEGMNKTDYIGYAIKELKRFAKIYQIHLIIAAHPAKPRRDKDGKFPVPTLYDISDSANFSNKADIGITIHRPDPESDATEIIINKVRYQDAIGKPGTVLCRYLFDQRRYESTPQPHREPT
jgi:twinkle protein